MIVESSFLLTLEAFAALQIALFVLLACAPCKYQNALHDARQSQHWPRSFGYVAWLKPNDLAHTFDITLRLFWSFCASLPW